MVKATPAEGGTQGVVEEIAKGAIEPVVDKFQTGSARLWTRHVEKDKLEFETKKTQLEAARWPEFGDIASLAAAFAWQFDPHAGSPRIAGTDLYDRPVLAVDPGMHTARSGRKPSTPRVVSP